MAGDSTREGSESPEALEHVKKIWIGLSAKSPVYQMLLGNSIEVISASKIGSIIARLTVEEKHLNSKGSLHGVMSACLIDWAGGMVIAATGLEKSGVSTDIHTSYVSGAKEGDILEIYARASKVGDTLAFTTVEITKVAGDGTTSVVSKGSHTKYVKQ